MKTTFSFPLQRSGNARVVNAESILKAIVQWVNVMPSPSEPMAGTDTGMLM